VADPGAGANVHVQAGPILAITEGSANNNNLMVTRIG